MTWHPMIISGTATAVLGVYLLLLKLSVNGRRPFLALTWWWVAAPASTSAFVLALFTGIAVSAFATAPSMIDMASSTSIRLDSTHDGFDGDDELVALSDYADAIGGSPKPANPEAKASSMPSVEEMIEKLAARLAQKPDDVRGWKMLGWSYLNTGRADEAVRAYETALRLVPGDEEIAAGLEAARAARTASSVSPANEPSASAP
jgi:tetratricopeptide (TPR) repeat protein